MRVLNILGAGNVGGIETLCKDIAENADYYNKFVFLFEEGIIYEEMKSEGYDVYSLVSYGLKKINYKRFNELCKIAEDSDIIVVHHRSLGTYTYYNMLRFVFRKKKFIFMAHSCFDLSDYSNDSFIKKKLCLKVLKKALKISDLIIFVSNAGKNSYISNFCINQNKVRVIYNGIRQNNESIINEHSVFFENEINITYTGRLVKEKGVQELIKAIQILRRMNIKTRVNICGEGSFRPYLEEYARELGVDDVVVFCGMQRDIKRYLIKTDIFVYPSIWEEVFGISIVEAMSYGVPCVVFNVGGVVEIVKDGFNGSVADRKDANSLADAIIKTINLYKTEGENLRKNCFKTSTEFTIDVTVKKMKECFEALTLERN
jgi:glycosyltransferase involved in cell wall biosynthesis